MRTVYVSICAFLACVVAMPLAAQTNKPSPDLTVILDFKGPRSQASLKEMEREAGRILKSSGFRLGWGLLGQDPAATYNDLVVFTFRGACEFVPAPPRNDELGPYALTRMTDGEVLPFGEVDCDRVVGAVRSAMSGSDYARGDELVGRAMGRVLAHELVHMVTKSVEHAHEGVQRPHFPASN
jgi:hypothetical protein